MALEWEQVVIDAADPVRIGRWWADALGWQYWAEVAEGGDIVEVEIRPTEDRLPGLLFGTVPEAKAIKNRLHLDFRPDDQAAEVERFLSLGAVPADVGQGAQPWVVLADPEGNEFCVLSSRRRTPSADPAPGSTADQD